jgi:class 3 adenylate cyclase
MDKGFFTKKHRKALEAASKKTCNGFLILLDIVGSTERKIVYRDKWHLHTEVFCNAFERLATQILQKAKGQDNTLKRIVVKFIGDGAMAFFKTTSSSTHEKNRSADQALAQIIFNETQSFVETVHQDESLCGMRLKTVLTYLTGVEPVKFNARNQDILGRGVDFSFRLERFADATHYTLNEMMVNALTNGDMKQYKTLSFRLCRRMVKGWDTAQTFYIATSLETIEDAAQFLGSLYDENVKSELFQFYIDASKESYKKQETESISKMLKG